MTARALSLLLFFTAYASGLCQHSSATGLADKTARALRVSYLGNMGVWLASGEYAVIIDGLHKKYKPAYSYPTVETAKKVIAGTYEDNGAVDMALFTHYHRDHFDPAYALAFLSSNPGSLLLASSQACDMIREQAKKDGLSTSAGLREIPYDGSIQHVQRGELSVKAFKCPHVNARHAAVQNLAFLIDINGYSVLHVGDSHWPEATSALKNAQLLEASIDVAILPYWMLLDSSSKENLQQLIRPKWVIATHIPPDISTQQVEVLRQYHGDITLFQELNQKISFE